jgi:branched-chain amino acid transport system ATP-binding protein
MGGPFEAPASWRNPEGRPGWAGAVRARGGMGGPFEAPHLQMTKALETRGLGRAFGALQAVAAVSLTVGTGELRAIIGPNGAGKTTLFHLISGLLAPTAGQIFFQGEEVSSLAAPARCRLGISRTFQITSIFPELSVLENVRMAVQLKGGGNFRLVGGAARLQVTTRRARESLDFLGLGARADEPAATLPHGDQRLLEMAMAVAQDPELLLLDEPTQGLSPEDTAATVAVIRQIARERHLTILLVEHDMDVVFDLAQRISVLNFGQLIAEGTPEEIRTNPDVQKAYLGGGD